MTQDENGWSEKTKNSGRGKRAPREGIDNATSEATSGSATPTRPSKRASDSGSDSTVVRAPATDQGARKVARAAATAGQRDVSFLSRMGFPALVALICVLGLLSVLFAWSTREALATPRQNLDHWHAVYSVYDCTTPGNLAPFLSSESGNGIHSHADGIIHVHPYFELSSGDNATMNHWFDAMGITVDNDKIVLDTGAELVAGAECADGSGAAEIRVLHWDFDFQAEAEEPPTEITTADFGSIKFDNDREVYIIAFAGPDADIPLPPADRFNTLDGVSDELEYTPTELRVEDTGVTVTGDADADAGTGVGVIEDDG